ncbi:MAG: sigma-70 family RNA polymerase sigma factor [Alphaproteobacteria bacterium]|nr:sigma-70 family RNA polymerase sigma factor [Alphaproteobacteria bacterium]
MERKSPDEPRLRGLMLAGISGDSAAHRAFLAESAALLRAFFRNRLRGAPEDAEDLVQDTLIALHTKRDAYDPAYPITAWIYAIARYRLIDHVRRNKRRGGVHLPLEDGDALAAEDHDAAEARHDAATLLDRLPQKQRDAIRLVKLEEKSVRETAAELGISESDVKISVHRGVKALAKYMADRM